MIPFVYFAFFLGLGSVFICAIRVKPLRPGVLAV